MKREYDFPKAQQGRFYRKSAQLNLPIYLEPRIQRRLERVARKTGRDIGDLVNQLVKKEIGLMEKLDETARH